MPYFGRRAINGRFTRLSRHPIRSGRLPTPLGKRIQPVSWYGSLTVRGRAPRHRQQPGAFLVADRQSTLRSSSSYRVSPFLKIPHANPIVRSPAFGTAHWHLRCEHAHPGGAHSRRGLHSPHRHAFVAWYSWRSKSHNCTDGNLRSSRSSQARSFASSSVAQSRNATSRMALSPSRK